MNINQIKKLKDIGIDQIEILLRDTKKDKSLKLKMNVKDILEADSNYGIDAFQVYIDQALFEMENK